VILLIDNYDSFVHNLGRYFQRLGQTIHVVRNDKITIEKIRELSPDAIVLSPGPCTPESAGICLEVVTELATVFPILGVCLGHQVIGQAFGAEVVLAEEPVHGRSSVLEHDGRGIFTDLPDSLTACRYHSLVVDASSLPPCLEKTAWLADGTIMGLRHTTEPVVGIQFHPESVLTSHGFNILAGFLKLAGIEVAANVPTVEDECRHASDSSFESPDKPVTF
tara:strand:+ start:4337 stop:4999 length:663 start_codon:yes stop_codon:yes gene_type:complete